MAVMRLDPTYRALSGFPGSKWLSGNLTQPTGPIMVSIIKIVVMNIESSYQTHNVSRIKMVFMRLSPTYQTYNGFLGQKKGCQET